MSKPSNPEDKDQVAAAHRSRADATYPSCSLPCKPIPTHHSRVACVKQLILAADAKAMVDAHGDSALSMVTDPKLKSRMNFQTVTPPSFLHLLEAWLQSVLMRRPGDNVEFLFYAHAPHRSKMSTMLARPTRPANARRRSPNHRHRIIAT
jgi:hypothetical protein